MNNMDISNNGDGSNDPNKNENNRNPYSIPNLAQTYNSSQDQYSNIGSGQNFNRYSSYNSSSQAPTPAANSYQLPPYQQQQQQQPLYQPSSYYQTSNNNINSNNGQLSRNGVDGYDSNNYTRLSVSNVFSPMPTNSNMNTPNNYNQNNQYGQQQSNSDYNYMGSITNTQGTNNNNLNNTSNNTATTTATATNTNDNKNANNNTNNSSSFGYQLPEMMYTQYMNQLANKANNPQQQQQQQQQQPLPSQSPSVSYNNIGAMGSNLPSLTNPQYNNGQNYNNSANKKLQTNSMRTLQNLLDMNNLPPPHNSDTRTYPQGGENNNLQNTNLKEEQDQETGSFINNKSQTMPMQQQHGNGIATSKSVTDGDQSNVVSENDSNYSNVFTNSSEASRDQSSDTTESIKPTKKQNKKSKKAATGTKTSKTKKSKKPSELSEEKDHGKKKKEKRKKKLGPKRPSSAYFLYFIAMRRQLIQAHPTANVPEVAKIASANWKEMTTEERKPYYDQFKIHWDEYLAAREAYKKSLPPKRPSGPFIKFTQDMRPKLAEENPEKNLIEVTKIIGQKWKELTDEGRAVYTNAYKVELRAWEKTVGFKRQNEEVGSTTTGEESAYTDTDDNHTDDVDHMS